MRLVFTLLLFSVVALAEGNNSDIIREGVKFIVSKRGALTFGQGELHGMTVPAVTGTGTFASYSSEFDVLFPFGLHIGWRESLSQSAEISFNGGNPERGEIYLSFFEFGAKLFVPLGYFQPWGGAGYLYGQGTFTNPRTRANDTWLAAFENETHGVWGNYFHAGVDVLVTDTIGIRAYYQQDDINVQRYHNLQTLENSFFIQRRWAVGIVGIVP